MVDESVEETKKLTTESENNEIARNLLPHTNSRDDKKVKLVQKSTASSSSTNEIVEKTKKTRLNRVKEIKLKKVEEIKSNNVEEIKLKKVLGCHPKSEIECTDVEERFEKNIATSSSHDDTTTEDQIIHDKESNVENAKPLLRRCRGKEQSKVQKASGGENDYKENVSASSSDNNATIGDEIIHSEESERKIQNSKSKKKNSKNLETKRVRNVRRRVVKKVVNLGLVCPVCKKTYRNRKALNNHKNVSNF